MTLDAEALDLLGPEPSAAPPDRLVSTAELAEWLDLSAVRVSALGRDGILPREGDRRYPLRACIRAYVAWCRENPSGRRVKDPGLQDEKLRLAREQADKIALQNARARGELLEAADVARRWATYTTALRAALLAVPPRVAAHSGLDRRAAATLDSEMRAALNQIATEGTAQALEEIE